MIESINNIFKIFKNTKEEHIAKAAVFQCQEILNNKTPIFFPEYTDHSNIHCEEIIETCIDIIPEYSKSSLTSKDLLFLCCSIILHDLGMHINEDFFQFLLKDKEWKSCPELESNSWEELWLDYLSEARRWDSRKLIAVFGEPEPINEPPDNNLYYTKKDRLLIGEFIRRNHGRLAHEIGINGYPKFDQGQVSTIQIFKDLDEIEIDLIGLIARSHTVDLRSVFPYLIQKFHLREFNQVHSIYLMVLLRISDYLQIQSSRAPIQGTQIRKIKSPFSNVEWKIHQSIQNITYATEDPEAIYIDSVPKSAIVYVRTRRWVNGLQNELDISWAILGETYGRFKGLKDLGLRIRRINSSFDDLVTLKKKIDYVPEYVTFNSANPDILKLLIDPLYGDDPSYGVRELLQNSVDAVLERQEYLKNNRQIDYNPIQQDSDVQVTIKTKDLIPTRVIISDKGIGMTPEIIINYFLKAGASFRKSQAWKKNYLDDQNNSKILRSGRFGIGVLACFLIGEEIVVTTKHITKKTGIRFKTGIDTEIIELNKVQCDHGTSIVIKISKANVDKIKSWINESYSSRNWDWFCLNKPTVKRIVLPSKKEFPQKHQVPSPSVDSNSLDPWNEFDFPGYQKIYWTQEYGFPNLICNGIKIKDAHSRDEIFNSDNFTINNPNISVFDPNGILPLNLERSKLKGERPFKKKLLNEIIEKSCEQIILNKPKFIETELIEFSELEYLKKFGIEHCSGTSADRKRIKYGPYLFTQNGLTLFTQNLVIKYKFPSINFVPENIFEAEIQLDNNQAITFLEEPKLSESERDLTRICLDLSGTYSRKYGILSELKVIGRISIIPNTFYQEHFIKGKLISKKILSKIQILDENENFKLIGIGHYDFKNSYLVKLFLKLKAKKEIRKYCATQYFLQVYDKYQFKEMNELEVEWLNVCDENILAYSKNK